MDWPTRPIKELCRIEKGAIGITKAKPGPYPLVTLAEERKEHNDYQFDTKAVIIPLVSSTGHGHASIKRIHYQEGKFTVGTILCAVVPNNESELHPLFLYHYLDVFKEQLLVPLMRGMANVTLPMRSLGDLEIPVPPIDDQLVWIEKFKSVNHKETKLLNALSNQQTLLKQLRQAILQEAVQGKLTEHWRAAHPEVEPASALLERIQAEKARLVKEKKIKKSKPLPPITPNEIPFDLPEGWVWCRLCDLGIVTGGGTPSKGNLNFWNGPIPWVSPKDMKCETVSDSELKITPEGVANSSAKLVPEGSLLIVGRSGILKRKIPVAINSVECTVNQDMKVLIPYLKSMNKYLQIMLFGLENYILRNLIKFGMTVHSLKYKEFEQQPFPIPPIVEQKLIVDKIESLLAKASALEQEVQQNQQYAEQLLQSVLREVMNPVSV